jgi:hypothetical protein
MGFLCVGCFMGSGCFAVTEANLVGVESLRFPSEQVLSLTCLEALEVGYVEKRTIFPDRLLQCFASGLKEIRGFNDEC